MEGKKTTYRFEPEVLKKMDEFERDFLSNGYKESASQNKGPGYTEEMAGADQNAFAEYLESEYATEFLNC